MEIEKMRQIYISYGRIQLENIEKIYKTVDHGIRLKIKHGISMSYAVPEITKKSGLFHESYEETAAIDGLLHDIGRFAQYHLIGSLKDADLEEQYGYKDHGRLGEILLRSELKDIFDLGKYGEIAPTVVGNHTEIYQPDYRINLADLPPIFQEYNVEEAMKNENLRRYLIAAKIKCVVEADNFELLQNIVSGDWKPQVSEQKEDFITKEVWEQFANNLPIMIAEFKRRKEWSINSGVLLRYGLLPQKAQLRSTLEYLLEQDYLRLLYERAIENMEKPDPLIFEGYLYTTLLVQNIIACSDPVIKEEQRKEAVQKTKKMWK